MTKIVFSKIGSHLGTRISGVATRERIASDLNSSNDIVFDFLGVETISNSFADECFAKLILDFEYKDIQSKIRFENTSPFIRSIISNAFEERLEKVSLI